MIKTPPSPPNPAWIAVWISVLALVVVVVGWFVVNHLTKKRERKRDLAAADDAKDNRRREFIGRLKKWQTEIRSPNPATIVGGYFGKNVHVSIYQQGIPTFHTWVEIVRDDFTDGSGFDALTKRITNLTEKDWQNKNQGDVICETLDALINFCSTKGQLL